MSSKAERDVSAATNLAHAAAAVPQTRAARHRRIVDILNRQPVRSQSQLAKLLSDDGLTVTQATPSATWTSWARSRSATPVVS